MKKRILYFLNNAEELIGASVFTLMFMTLVLQIVFRQVFDNPLVWSEELSMMLFVYVALLGVSSEIKDDGHVGIDLISGKLSPVLMKVVAFTISVCTLLCLVVFLLVGIELTERKAVIEMVGLGISSGYLYGALPVLSILMLFRFFQRLYINLKKKGG
ncbi:TRAP transporter small permease [Vibrio aquaticus]|uniref:TRAP transporter small permease n=1 Tax=Vibrio aquaticus TaxID=2496559 RepID=UPI001ABF731C|nr:TRAP transporter small permease [Vibrio aquaticus]